MKTHRGITTAATLTALVLAVAPTATASSLLSGYGGPGQGSQAILGSALINGPSGGGSGSAGSSSGGSAGSPTTSAAAGGGSGSGGSSTGHTGAHTGKTHAQVQGKSSKTGSAAQTPSAVSLTPQSSVGGSRALGLSGADILYMLLALAALVATGLLTRQMARRPG